MGDEALEATAVPANEVLDGTMTALYDELRTSQDSLRTLSEETGGFASVTSNDFGTAFQRIVDANSSYYVLGYYAANVKRDGRYRKIAVRLSRPGLTVNARKGYMAPRGKPASDKKVEASAGTSKELRGALQQPAPGVACGRLAAPLKAVAESHGRQTQFPAGLAFTKDGKSPTIEMSYVAINKQAVAAGTGFIDMSLKPTPTRESRPVASSRGSLPPDLSAASRGARRRRQDRVVHYPPSRISRGTAP
jgi:hypothetical protein